MEPVYNIINEEDDGPGPSKKFKSDEPKSDVQNKPPSLSDLPGNKCVYLNCGKTRRDDPALKKYKFPKNQDLQQKWAINSGNLSLLSLAPDVLHRKTVCSEHFDDSHFVNPQIKRSFVKGAVPKPYNSDSTNFKSLMPIKVLKNLSSSVHSESDQEVTSHKAAKNESYAPLNEPEIKVETIVNKESDPLQLSKESHGSQYKQHDAEHTFSSKTVIKSFSVPKDSPAQKCNVPVILRKVAKPPEAVLKELQRHNKKPNKRCDGAKFTPLIQTVKVLPGSNPGVSATVQGIDQPNTSKQTSHTIEYVGTKIVGDVVDLLNDLEGDDSENKNKGKKHCEVVLQNKGPGSDKTSDQSLPDTDEQMEARLKSAVLMKNISTECCTFLGCKLTKENSYLKFYKFPTNYETAKKCLAACNRPDILFQTQKVIEEFVSKSVGVCFRHKTAVTHWIGENDCTSNAERETVIKHLHNVDDKITKVQHSQEETAKSNNSDPAIAVITYFPHREFCAFINCSTFIKDPRKRYRFPADEELLAQWLEAAGIPEKPSDRTLRTLFVCGKHFNPDQYTEMGTLILSSVPTPHTEFVDSSPHEGNQHWENKQIITKKKGEYLSMSPKLSAGPSTTVASSTGVSTTLPRTTTTVVLDKQIPEASYSTSAAAQAVRRPILYKILVPSGSDSNTGLNPGSPKHQNRRINRPHATGPPRQQSRPPRHESRGIHPSPDVSGRLESKCAIKGCSSNRKTNCLYAFPENPHKFVEWVRAIEGSNFTMNTNLISSYSKKMICYRHFEKRYEMENKILTNDAVPSLHLFNETPEDQNGSDTETDTSIIWTERSRVIDTVLLDPSPHIKGNAILREDGIEFPNIGRQLKFGKDCPKMGYLKRFPYKVYRMTRKSKRREPESIKPDHKIQIHTAIIVDDDDQAEKEAIKVISRIITENANSLPLLRTSRKKKAVTNSEVQPSNEVISN